MSLRAKNPSFFPTWAGVHESSRRRVRCSFPSFNFGSFSYANLSKVSIPDSMLCSGFEFHFPRLAFPDSTVQYLELGIWSSLSWSRQQLSILFCGQDLWALSWSTVSLAPSGSILSSGFVASLSWSRASNSGLCFELRIWAQSWSKASTSGLCFELRIWAQSWSKASKSGLYFELRIWAQSWSKASNSGLCFVLRIWAHSWSKASTSGLYSQLGILASLSWSLAIATPDSILCSGFELRPGLRLAPLGSIF